MSRRVMSMFRWPAVDLTSYLPSSFFRPPEFSFPSLNFATGWTTPIREANFWVVDNLLWVVVTVVESVALLAFLCCFFALCGWNSSMFIVLLCGLALTFGSASWERPSCPLEPVLWKSWTLPLRLEESKDNRTTSCWVLTSDNIKLVRMGRMNTVELGSDHSHVIPCSFNPYTDEAVDDGLNIDWHMMSLETSDRDLVLKFSINNRIYFDSALTSKDRN
ncbi:hypothetical protein AKJ16_DCAP14000 [Drosera capensis]